MKEYKRPFRNLGHRQRELAKVLQRFGYTVHLPLKEDEAKETAHARGTTGEAERTPS